MKAWLKGGLIACGIVIALFIIFFLTFIGKEAEAMMPVYFLLAPGTLINQTLLYIFQRPYMSFLLSLSFYFGLGSLIGFIISKLKKKKEVAK